MVDNRRRRKVVDVGLPGEERDSDPGPSPARGKYLGYDCPVCGKPRQTSAARPPDRCAVCGSFEIKKLEP